MKIQSKLFYTFALLLAPAFFVSCVDFTMAKSETRLSGSKWICEEVGSDVSCEYKVIGSPSAIVKTPLIDDFNDFDSISEWGGVWEGYPSVSDNPNDYGFLTISQDNYSSTNKYLQVSVYANQLNVMSDPPIGLKLYISSSKKETDIQFCDSITYDYMSYSMHRFALESKGVSEEFSFGVNLPASTAWTTATIIPSDLTQQINAEAGTLDLAHVRSMIWMLPASGASLSIDNVKCNFVQSSSSSASSSSSVSAYCKNNPDKCGQFYDDRDLQEYPWVKVGDQIWMSKNLNYGPYTIAGSSLNDAAVDKFCSNNDSLNCESEGGFYNWSDLMGLAATCEGMNCELTSRKGLCPTGFHVPSYTEWNTFLSAVALLNGNGSQLSSETWSSLAPAFKDKYSWDPAGKDIIGFSIQNLGYPSGGVWYPGYSGYSTGFWTSTDTSGSAYRYAVTFSQASNDISYVQASGWTSYNVRCIDDDGVAPDSTVPDISSSSTTGSSSGSLDSGRLTTAETGDTNTYGWVRLNGKRWLSENINAGPFVLLGSTVQYIPQRICQDNLEENCHNGYGGFYDWVTAQNRSASCNNQICGSLGTLPGICPTGWRIPTMNEWVNLGLHYTADALRGSSGWSSGSGSNTSGFNALPAGFVQYAGGIRSFVSQPEGAFFWAADENNLTLGYRVFLDASADTIQYNTVDKTAMLSVRCISDN
jgi:uncharacterized protein (TIGR02145 family)